MVSRFRRIIGIAIGLVALSGLVVAPAVAQVPQPNVAVRVYLPAANGKEPAIYVATFAPGNTAPLNRFDIADPNSFFTISPDGKWIGMVTYDPSGDSKVSYGPVGQPPKLVTTDAGYQAIYPVFSADSRYFAFALSILQPSKWQLVIIDLASGQAMKFAGDAAFPPAPKPAAGFYGGLLPLAWSPDGKHIYVSTYSPGTEGTLGGPYEIDLSPFQFGQPGPLTIASVREISQIDATRSPFSPGLFSRDATRVIFGFNDTARPVPNYAGMGEPINTLSVIDVAGGKALATIQAQPDEGFELINWSSDGSRAIFLSGKYRNDPVLGPSFDAPKLYILDAASGQATAGPSLTAAQDERVVSMAGCGDTLFYVVGKSVPGQNSFTSTLYSAPFANPGGHSGPLLSGPFPIDILTCVP